MQEKDYKKPFLENLVNDLYHPNPNINYRACNDMIKYWPAESIKILINNLDSKDVTLRRKSVNALGQFGLLVIDPIANLVLESQNEIIKVSCLKVFVRIAKEIDPNKIPPQLIDVIKNLIDDERPLIILSLVSLLRELRQGGLEYLKDLAKDSNILRSQAAITAILEINDTSISII